MKHQEDTVLDWAAAIWDRSRDSQLDALCPLRAKRLCTINFILNIFGDLRHSFESEAWAQGL